MSLDASKGFYGCNNKKEVQTHSKYEYNQNSERMQARRPADLIGAMERIIKKWAIAPNEPTPEPALAVEQDAAVKGESPCLCWMAKDWSYEHRLDQQPSDSDDNEDGSSDEDSNYILYC